MLVRICCSAALSPADLAPPSCMFQISWLSSAACRAATLSRMPEGSPSYRNIRRGSVKKSAARSFFICSGVIPVRPER